MPELPEMETYRQWLDSHISGKPITDIIINREKSINMEPADFIRKIRNQEIVTIKRRAKYLLFYLNNGSILLLHLMLGGSMFVGKEEEKPKRKAQIIFSFQEEHLYFIGL